MASDRAIPCVRAFAMCPLKPVPGCPGWPGCSCALQMSSQMRDEDRMGEATSLSLRFCQANRKAGLQLLV